MDNRALNFKVGLFVLGSIAVFAVLAVLAVGSELGKRKVDYVIQFHETVKGMVAGSPVNFQGVQIGVVSDMRFVDGMTEVTVSVDPERAPIQTATRASLDRAWVTGQVTVELSGWERGGTHLEPGGSIAAELSPGAVVMRSLPEMVGRVTEILEEFEGVAKGLNRLLSSDSDILGNANTTLAELRVAAGRINDILTPENAATVRRILHETEATLHGMRGVGPRAQDAVDRVATMLRQELPKLSAAGQELGLFLRGNRRELALALAGLQSTLREVQGLARLLRGTPSALVFGRNTARPRPRDIRTPALPPPSPGGKE